MWPESKKILRRFRRNLQGSEFANRVRELVRELSRTVREQLVRKARRTLPNSEFAINSELVREQFRTVREHNSLLNSGKFRKIPGYSGKFWGNSGEIPESSRTSSRTRRLPEFRTFANSSRTSEQFANTLFGKLREQFRTTSSESSANHFRTEFAN